MSARAACLAVVLALAAAGPATPRTRQPQPFPPTFEQKMAWVLQLEDQRVLRAPAPPPAVAEQAPPKGRRARPVPVEPPPAPDLIRLLEDPEGRVRRRAAQAVGRVGLAEGVAPLAAVLAGDRDAEVRQMAAFAMGLIGHRSAVEPLRAALRDPSLLVQGRAAEALGLIGDAESAQAIASMATARLAAVKTAGLEADEGAYPLDPAAEALRLAIYALTRLKAADALVSAVLDPAGQPRLAWWPVAYALARTEDARVVPALATLLRSGGSVARAFAARGLGARRAAESVAALVPLAQGWRADPRVAVAAIRALAQIGSGEAAAPLRAVAQARDADPNLRLEALAALGALKDPASVEIALDAVTDRWPAISADKRGTARSGPSAGRSDTTVVLTLGCGSASSPDKTMTKVSRSMSLSARRPAALIAGHGSLTASSTTSSDPGSFSAPSAVTASSRRLGSASRAWATALSVGAASPLPICASARIAATAARGSSRHPCASATRAVALPAALRAPIPRAAKERDTLPPLRSKVASAGTTRASSVRERA